MAEQETALLVTTKYGESSSMPQEEKDTIVHKGDPTSSILEEYQLRLKKVCELQDEGCEYLTKLKSEVDFLSENVTDLKEFIEKETTIDFHKEAVNEFNACMAKAIRICHMMSNIDKNKILIDPQQVKHLENQILCTINDLKTKMDSCGLCE